MMRAASERGRRATGLVDREVLKLEETDGCCGDRSGARAVEVDRAAAAGRNVRAAVKSFPRSPRRYGQSRSPT